MLFAEFITFSGNRILAVDRSVLRSLGALCKKDVQGRAAIAYAFMLTPSRLLHHLDSSLQVEDRVQDPSIPYSF